MESKDALSGVNKIYYKFDSENSYSVYDAKTGISTASLKDGSHVLSYYAVDHVENREMPQKFQFYLDRTPPEIAYTFVGDHYFSKNTHYISPRSRIKIDANDTQVEVKNIQYAVNGLKYETYLAPFTPAIKSGEFNISYSTSDELKNSSNPELIKLVMDPEPPVTSYEVSEPLFIKEKGVLYVTKASKISLKATDALSSVQEISYQIGEGQAQKYEAPFSLSGDGRYLLRYWASDKVNNQESISTILVIADNTPPEIVEIFSLDPVNSKAGKDTQVPTYPLNASLTLNGIDSSAGVKSIAYTLNDAPLNEYKGPIVFSKSGKYKLKVQIEDRVGNKSSKTSDIVILDKTWNQTGKF